MVLFIISVDKDLILSLLLYSSREITLSSLKVISLKTTKLYIFSNNSCSLVNVLLFSSFIKSSNKIDNSL